MVKIDSALHFRSKCVNFGIYANQFSCHVSYFKKI